MQKGDNSNFKEELIHLHDEFFTYLRKNSCKGVPLKQLVVMLQKYLQIRPTDLCALLNRTIHSKLITWDKLLTYLQDEINLRDQVTKYGISKPSVMEVAYSRSPDEGTGQQIGLVVSYLKRKETNLIKQMIGAEFLGFRLLAVVLEKEILFYDCQEFKILSQLDFKYHNVRSKTMSNQKGAENYSSSLSYEYVDRVNPMSRRTDDLFFTAKNRKNTTQSDELKNVISSNMMKSKVESINSDNNDLRRSITDMGPVNRLMSHKLTSIHRAASKKPMIKIRSNDEKNIFKIMTETSIENSIEFMKAVKNSRESFEKYVVVEKEKVEPQKQEELVKPSSLVIKRNFRSQIQQMKRTSKNLSCKKESAQFLNSSLPLKSADNFEREDPPRLQTDAYSILEKKILGIQSVSFCQNYLLVSLMNREVRLYSFKKTISGFQEELVFERSFDFIVSYVLLYHSQMRRQFNVAIAKLLPDDSTNICVFQLTNTMSLGSQAYSTSIAYAPVFEQMLPLGIGGFTEKGNFFILELNSPGRVNCETKSIDTVLVNNESGQRVSITSIKMHSNFINVYLGCKDGEVYIYDRFSKSVRLRAQLAKHAIRYLSFINKCQQFLFWEDPDKVGIANSDTLMQSNVTLTDSGYHSIVPFFGCSHFLIYGNRKIGLVSLTESEQKRFTTQKPLKVYKRRQRMVKSQPKDQESLEEGGKRKILRTYTGGGDYLVSICSDGEIMVFDSKLEYTGSYFTFNFSTISQCGACSSLKYLSLLHENNQIEVVNIYTQEHALAPISSKEEVYDAFFCHSSVYFCGYLTTQNSTLFIYGFSTPQPLIKISLNHLLGEQVRSRSCWVRFYKGAMIVINFEKGQILFLMKKTCERNKIVRCWTQGKGSLKQARLHHQSGTLSIVREDDVVQVYSIERKEKVYEWALRNHEEEGCRIHSHHYSHDQGRLSILWESPPNKYSRFRVKAETGELELDRVDKLSVPQDAQEEGENFVVGDNVVAQEGAGKYIMLAGDVQHKMIDVCHF